MLHYHMLPEWLVSMSLPCMRIFLHGMMLYVVFSTLWFQWIPSYATSWKGTTAWEAVGDGSSASVLASHVRDVDWIHAYWLQPGPFLTVVIIWRVSQQMKWSINLSLVLENQILKIWSNFSNHCYTEKSCENQHK